MTKVRVIKYFKGPAFTADIWSDRNPYLRSGEIGYLLEGGITKAAKVGPGYWNDLGFLGEDIYTAVEDVTNPIGDATGNLQGETLADIIKMMLSPYETPDFQNIRLIINSQASVENVYYLEVGQSLTSASVIYNLLNAQNLSGGTPINVTATSDINPIDSADSGSIALSLISPPIQPVTNKTIGITLKATHTNGQTNGNGDDAQIIFRPRIMWVTSGLQSITDGSTFMGHPQIQYVLSSDYKLDYTINGNGYVWLAIPTMLSPNSPIFTDVTNPNAPADYAMSQQTTFSIYNGVGTYNYTLFRSDFYLIQSSKLRVS
jgi:hypothetical protein